MAKMRLKFESFKDSNGNIRSAELWDSWPNGRPIKNGAVALRLNFPDQPEAVIISEIQDFMEDRDLFLNEDYTIPPYNFMRWKTSRMPIIVTFTSEEKFVMAKLGWDLEDNGD